MICAALNAVRAWSHNAKVAAAVSPVTRRQTARDATRSVSSPTGTKSMRTRSSRTLPTRNSIGAETAGRKPMRAVRSRNAPARGARRRNIPASSVSARATTTDCSSSNETSAPVTGRSVEPETVPRTTCASAATVVAQSEAKATIRDSVRGIEHRGANGNAGRNYSFSRTIGVGLTLARWQQ